MAEVLGIPEQEQDAPVESTRIPFKNLLGQQAKGEDERSNHKYRDEPA